MKQIDNRMNLTLINKLEIILIHKEIILGNIDRLVILINILKDQRFFLRRKDLLIAINKVIRIVINRILKKVEKKVIFIFKNKKMKIILYYK